MQFDRRVSIWLRHTFMEASDGELGVKLGLEPEKWFTTNGSLSGLWVLDISCPCIDVEGLMQKL